MIKFDEDDFEVRCPECNMSLGHAPKSVWSAPPGDVWCYSCWSDIVDARILVEDDEPVVGSDA